MRITLKPATQDDWGRLYDWKNHESTRAASLNHDPVSLDEHVKWLKHTLANDKVKLFIAYEIDTGECLGTGRLDLRTALTTELSLTVDPRQRGKGCAKAIIGDLSQQAWTLFPTVTTVKAQVRVDNFASLRAFAACGYYVAKVKDGVAELRYERD